MMKHLNSGKVLAALLLGISIGFAQPEDYFSAQAMEEIPAAQVSLSYEFLYRIQPDSIMRFYKLRMTDGLYRTKNAFLWPEQVKSADRIRMPVYGSSEIIFNDRLILADVDALFFRSDTGMVALQAIPLPGIVIVRTPKDALYQEIERTGIQPERPLPTALYTFRDTAKVCLIRSAGYIPKEYDPYTPEKTFRLDEVILDSFPPFQVLPHFLNDGMENASADSASLAALEKKIRELEEALHNDSTHVAEYQTNLRNSYPQAMPLRPYEDSATYYSRARVRDVEALALSAAAYSQMGFSKAMLPLRERIFQLKEVHTSLLKEAEFYREPKTAYLHNKVWDHVFLSVQTILGRNMPEWTYDPGATDLWGFSGRLQFEHRLVHRLSWTLHATAGQAQWKYHDLIEKESKEIWAGGGAGVAIPILVFPRGFAWRAETGGLVLYRNTDVVNDWDHNKHWGTQVGFFVGSQFLFSPIAIQMDIRYQYTTNGFGDLLIGLGFPLPWIGGSK